MALAGITVGIIASFGFTRLIANLLFGVRSDDPATFASVAILLALVSVAACYIPARRAMRERKRRQFERARRQPESAAAAGPPPTGAKSEAAGR